MTTKETLRNVAKGIILKIFDIPNDGKTDIDMLEMMILEKINSGDLNLVDYFCECYNREIKYLKNNNLTFRKFLNIILLDEEDDMIHTLITKINSKNLEFIEHFFKYNTDKNFADRFVSKYFEIKYLQRLEYLKIILRSKYFRDNVFNTIYTTGKINEDKSIFGLLFESYIEDKEWNMNIEHMIDILSIYMSDDDSCHILVKMIHQIFHVNKCYANLNQSVENMKNCSSVRFLTMLNKIMMVIFDNKKNYQYTKLLIRKEYEIKNDENLLDLIILTLLTGINISYNILPKIHNNLNNELMRYDDNFFLFSFGTDINEKKETLRLYIKRLKKIMSDVNYQNSVNESISYISNNEIILSDFYTDVWASFLIGRIIDFNIKQISCNDVKYLVNVMSGIYEHNKHTKFIMGTFISVLIDSYSVDYFKNEYDESICRYILNGVIKYIVTVDHFDLASVNYSHKVYQLLLKLVVQLIQSNMIQHNADVNDKTMIHFFHKISSKLNNLVSDVSEICKKIQDLISNNAMISKNECVKIMNDYIRTNICCINVLIAMCEKGLIKELEFELAMPVSAFTVAILKILSNGGSLIYTYFNMNMEALELMQILFKFVNMCCKSKIFSDILKDNKDIISEMVHRTKLDNKLRSELISNFGEMNDVIEDIELPDEFMDPILVVEIKNPVMIPKIDRMFDKSSIMSHLYNNEKNPFTRESLTIKEFEEYNKRDDVIEKIGIFRSKLESYKKSNQ